MRNPCRINQRWTGGTEGGIKIIKDNQVAHCCIIIFISLIVGVVTQIYLVGFGLDLPTLLGCLLFTLPPLMMLAMAYTVEACWVMAKKEGEKDE
jgi:hypothetical protein